MVGSQEVWVFLGGGSLGSDLGIQELNFPSFSVPASQETYCHPTASCKLLFCLLGFTRENNQGKANICPCLEVDLSVALSRWWEKWPEAEMQATCQTC